MQKHAHRLKWRFHKFIRSIIYPRIFHLIEHYCCIELQVKIWVHNFHSHVIKFKKKKKQVSVCDESLYLVASLIWESTFSTYFNDLNSITLALSYLRFTLDIPPYLVSHVICLLKMHRIKIQNWNCGGVKRFVPWLKVPLLLVVTKKILI